MSTQKYIKIGGQVPIVLKEIACTLKDKTATDASLQEIEASLEAILDALQAGQDYEAKLVVDSDVPPVTYLEVRIWNPDTQTWEPPQYYLPGSNTPSSPVLPISYINPNTFLAQIVTNTTGAPRTPNIIRTSASGNVNTVAATFYSVSVANVGTADGSILGGVNNIKSGEILNFDSGSLNNTFNSFAYDATGTEFIITFIS
jgi:hypothetical protein